MTTDIHPIDQLRIQYAQSVDLPPSPERALVAEARLRLIREDTTEAERIAVWKRFASLPPVRK